MYIRDINPRDIQHCLKLLSQLTEVGKVDNPELILEKINTIYVAEIDKNVIGMITLFIEQKFIHNGGKVGHIEDVVVDKNYRKMGIGKRLIDHCIDICKNQKCYKIILDCSIDNKEFYEKCGFHQNGICMRINL